MEPAPARPVHPGHRVLNDEERLLWREIGRSLDRRNLPMPQLAASLKGPARVVAADPALRETAPKDDAKVRKPPELPAYRPPVSMPGERKDQPPGLDTKTSRKLMKGRIPIEARLDLHGMTQQRAHDALQAFLAECQLRDRRMALVITGKGQASGGILRNLVPRWLAEPAMRLHVSGFGEAHAVHGGSGALYVRIRRRGR
jgi:DNA-nicking Smr family endonuclease